MQNLIRAKLGNYLKDCARVLSIAKRPNLAEYKQVAKLTGLGMVVIGLLGLLVTIVFSLFKL